MFANQSNDINEIAQALNIMQGEITTAKRDKDGYGYIYADLAQIIEIIQPLLRRNGLSVTQSICKNDDKSYNILTKIRHKSGQWIVEDFSMPPITEKVKNSPEQCMGSLATYGRRYALSAAFMIAQEDKDAINEKIERDQIKDNNVLIDSLMNSFITQIEEAYTNDDKLKAHELTSILSNTWPESNKKLLFARLSRESKMWLIDLSKNPPPVETKPKVQGEI